MVTGVGDGSIFIYPVVFLFFIFFPSRHYFVPPFFPLSFPPPSVLLLAREYPSRVRVSSIQSPATVCPPFVRSFVRSFLSVSIHRGVSSPSRFAPKLRLLEPCRFPDSYVFSSLSPFSLAFLPPFPPFRSFSFFSFFFFLFFLCFFSGDSVVNGDIRGAARTTVHLFTTVSIRWINQSM